MLLLFALSGADMLKAQPYYFKHYEVENGLSNNAVICIMQDHLGFMWFGTRDGLNRFDGLSYKIFRNDPSKKNTIGSNAIMSLSEDDENKIWVGTEKGLFVFDELTESFSQLKEAGINSVFEVKTDGDMVYYNTLYTLYGYNKKTKKLKTFVINNEVTSYCILKDKSLWVSTSAGAIAKYNFSKNSFGNAYDMFEHSGYAVSRWIQSVYDVGDSLLLIGTSNQGLKLFDIRTSTYKDILTLNTDNTDIIVRDILAINKDEYWIATQSGIYILNIKTGVYSNLKKNYEDPYSLSDNIVHSLCMDHQGGIWAGTYFGGVNYFPKLNITFKKYFHETSKNSISGNAVSEIKEDKNGMLWIATEDAGLNKFNPKTGNFINFNPETNKQSVSYSNIHALLIDNNRIWAGTYLHGLDLLDLNGKRLYNYNTTNTSLGSNFICALLKTSTGNIIAATDKGLYKYLPHTNNFELIKALPKAFFLALHEDKDGNVWAGTYGDGVYVYNIFSGKIHHYFFSVNHNQNIAANIVNYIFYQNNTLWFATEGGLCSYQPEKKILKIFTTKDGFPADVIYAVIGDTKKNLWVSTSKGLVRFNPSTKKVKIFSKSHGLLTDQFNYRSVCKDRGGNFYFGSVKGLISFNPDSIGISQFIPPIYITGFQVYNKELPIDSNHSPLKQSITFTKKITLKYNQSSINIDFAALNFSSPPTVTYAYKLEGLEKEWTYLKTNRKAYFTELPPGNYSFVVKNLDDKNRQNNFAKLDIEILPPFWKTWWAYIIYAILFTATTFLVFKFFIDRSKARHKRKLEKLTFEKEKENYEDKINFFTNVAHEIKTPLTLIKGPMENIMDKIDEVPSIKNSVELMSRSTDRLMHLANQLLDFRKIETNGFILSFEKTNIANILYDNYLRFKGVASQRKIEIYFTAEDNLFAYADEEALNKIFSNLIDNAIKYAGSKVYIKLSFCKDDKSAYQVIFKNDGFIIPDEQKDFVFESFYRIKATTNHAGTGIGLTLSRSLAEMHGGTLMLKEPEDGMNVFLLQLPVNPETKK